ncbi:hypothetical protein DFJ58DRAFT_128618 [Suillus subalutaceus]|uniref:uncharacterized protein n=1 Tax=Suillus subalutaceus TaxID=48586 RepID=UPI001B886C46|nr:uncharacterized protein DFJ58DRAFT_128618 [Suillus subalutaceus]KAG1867229.1 hypothetical protein DFJ58DRAFT_128618 [Suillus subalutaceus]
MALSHLLSQIWRLYVVWNQNFKLCILPLIMWVAHCTTASIAVALLASKNTSIFSRTFRVFALSGWSLEMTLNVTVTAGTKAPCGIWGAHHNLYMRDVLFMGSR